MTLDITTKDGEMETFICHPERKVLRQAGWREALGAVDCALPAAARVGGRLDRFAGRAYVHDSASRIVKAYAGDNKRHLSASAL